MGQLFRDVDGYLSDQSLDGGDSAVRAGLLSVFTGKPDNLPYYVKNGHPMRHPIQRPWNNWKNFTKDQLKCLVAGLVAIGRQDIIKEIIENLGFFCPNSERDYPGTTKYPWPHIMTGGDPKDEGKWRMFDFADPLLPNDWEFLKVAAGLKKPGGIGLWWHLQALKKHAKSDHNEENQMFCECYVLGTLKQYTELNPRWRARSDIYWSERNETEYHNLLVDFLFTQGCRV